MKYRGMSVKVLQRKRKKRASIWLRSVAVAVLVWVAGCAGFAALLEHKRLAAVNAPSWADFRRGGDTYETDNGTTLDGVPSSITVNGEDWGIVRVELYKENENRKASDRYNGRDASTDCKHRTISYIRNGSARALRVAIMHEVFHAGACLHGGDTWWNSEFPTPDFHPGVYHLGEFMATFARDNPEFMTWETAR